MKIKKLPLVFILFFFILGGCSTRVKTTTATHIDIQPSYTVTGTQAPAATPTSEPTISFPVVQGTPLPANLPQTMGQSGSVTLLAQWGKGSIHDVAWSPDGSVIVIATDGGIEVDNAGDLSEKYFIPQVEVSLSIVFYSDGKHFISAGNDGYLRIWETVNGEALQNLDLKAGSITHLSLSPDSSVAAAVAGENAVLIDLATMNIIQTIKSDTSSLLYSVSFSPDGKSILLGTSHGSELFDLVNDRLIYNNGNCTGLKLLFTKDGKWILGSEENGLNICRASDGVIFKNLQKIYDFALSPDGSKLASIEYQNPTPKIWDTSNWTVIIEGKKSFSFNGDEGHLVFSPDGNELILGLGRWDLADSSLSLFQVSDGTLIAYQAWDTAYPHSLAYSPDGNYLAEGLSKCSILLRDPKDGSIISTFTAPNEYWPCSVTFSPDGQYMASLERSLVIGNAKGNKIFIWKVSDGTILFSASVPSESSDPVFSPDSKTIAYVSDGKLKIRNVPDGTIKNSIDLDQPVKLVGQPAFSPDGKYIAAGASDHSVYSWYTTDAKPYTTFPGSKKEISRVIFSPDGRLLAAGGANDLELNIAGGIEVWDFGDSTVRHELESPAHYSAGMDGYLGLLDFSADGKNLLSVSVKGTIVALSIETGNLAISPGVNNFTRIVSLAPSVDGKRFATVSESGIIRIWIINQ